MTESNRRAATVRPERRTDIDQVHAVNVASFPTSDEADLVDRLRADPSAWIDGLAYVAEADGQVVGFALATRAHVGDVPVLALAPCAVQPAYQGRGVGTAVIAALLEAARRRAEQAVVVLGHAEYYPRFGFVPASRSRVTAPFDVPDEAFLALALGDAPVPAGPMRYAAAFGV